MAAKDEQAVVETPAVTVVPSVDSELKEVVVPPRYWMDTPDGGYLAATTETDRVNYEAVGCTVSKNAPKGMPAATEKS